VKNIKALGATTLNIQALIWKDAEYDVSPNTPTDAVARKGRF
jgi:hypothetical protein